MSAADAGGAPLRFDGRTAVVTGGGRGLGRAYAELLAARGAAVVVNDLGVEVGGGGHDSAPAEEVAAAIRAAGGSAVADPGDISDPAAAERLIAAAREHFGGIDLVVNNAGIVRASTFPELDLGELREHLAVHLEGSFNVTRAAWPSLAEQGYGRVVLTSSSAIFGDAAVLPYVVAKSAILGLNRALAAAGREVGILVNAVAPFGQTRMAGSARPDEGAEQAPVRGLDPALAAAVVAYLCHQSCQTSGELYSAGGGTAARITLVVGLGINDPELTPEVVAAEWARVNDIGQGVVPRDMYDWAEMRMQSGGAGR